MTEFLFSDCQIIYSVARGSPPPSHTLNFVYIFFKLYLIILFTQIITMINIELSNNMKSVFIILRLYNIYYKLKL